MVFVPIIFKPLPNVSFETFAKPKNIYWDEVKEDFTENQGPVSQRVSDLDLG